MNWKCILMPAIIMIILFVVPISPMLVDILYGYLWIISILLNCKKNNKIDSLPILVPFLVSFNLALAIAFERNFFSYDASFILQKIEIINFNSIVNIIFSIVILVYSNIYIIKITSRNSEIASRFISDSEKQRVLDIISKQNSGEVTQEEAKYLIKAIWSDVDYYSKLDESTKFLSWNAILLDFLYLVFLLRGCYIGIIKNGLLLKETLTFISFAALVNSFLNIVPLILISFCINRISKRGISQNSIV